MVDSRHILNQIWCLETGTNSDHQDLTSPLAARKLTAGAFFDSKMVTDECDALLLL